MLSMYRTHAQLIPGYYGAPNLVIEIVSPSRSWPQMVQKASEFLRNGNRQVWLVFPNQREIKDHTAEGLPAIYEDDETLPVSNLVPKFALDVTAVFR